MLIALCSEVYRSSKQSHVNKLEELNMRGFKKILGMLAFGSLFAVMTSGVSWAQYVDSNLDRYGNFSCVSSPSGGKECTITLDRLTSIVTTPCSDEKTADPSSSHCAALNFDPATIKEIASMHPRFAATLAKLRGMTAGQANHVKIYWFPIEVTSEDVSEWLDSDEESVAFLKKLSARALIVSRRGPVRPLTYELTCQISADSSLATLKLQVVKDSKIDPSYSSLDMALVNEGDKEWKIKGWHINKNEEKLSTEPQSR
jgi:hypothetical protein